MAKGFFAQMAADAERRRKEQERFQREHDRQYIRAQREAERYAKQKEKEAREAHVADRSEKTEEQNKELAETLKQLEGILGKSLPKKYYVFDELKRKEDFPPFNPAQTLATPIREPTREQFYANIKELGGLSKRMKGAQQKYEQQKLAAEQSFTAAWYKWQTDETNRKDSLGKAQKDYEVQKAAFLNEVEDSNAEVAKQELSYGNGEPEAVVSYYTMVLERSMYPEGFPQEFRIANVPESRELVVDYELPPIKVIPSELEFRYVKAKDEITSKARTKADIKERYQDIVAAVTLRTISEVLTHDRGDNVDVVVFNGNLRTVDKATGKDVRPCLISVRTTKENFSEINLSKVDKHICLKNLGASVSPRASEALAIKPIIEFDMVDRRFVEDDDVLAGLESRPNLMDLNPYEFENLVTNLFTQMGLESKLTRSSKDGGIDCVAFDARPVVGGKVVIQAKRWKNTVGVSAVRDLYGTMMNEGANKGILVTTSGYGPDAFTFANDKPIELIDGPGLLYYLEQIGTKVRIIMPEE
jgi:restriction system protein